MKHILKSHFGHDEFRPLQEEIIQHVIDKKDSLVLMPTGGGKSLCYQLPALHFSGLTLVISPLIALMKDQVDSLKLNGIAAEFINSSLSVSEITAIQHKVRKGEVKILYIAPERLAIQSFQDFLKQLEISLIAIDEAHCISEWGHDFRPDYRNLKIFREIIPDVPIIALTATATERTRVDIVKQLDLRSPEIFISSFNRKNLTFTVRKKRQTFKKLIGILEKYRNESAIIYCFSRKDTEKLAKRLQENGYKALPYHAGLDKETRKQTQEKFIKDDISVIVATIAFGMGIDKSNIRLIVHYSFPKSIEGYYQEIGRAGRDGLSAECVMFYSFYDKFRHKYFIDKIADPTVRYNTKTKLEQVIKYCEQNRCRRRYLLEYFGEKYYVVNCSACDFCLHLKDEEEDEDEDFDFIKKPEGKYFNLDYDIDLFEKLRVLRKRMADESNVPPYIIFNDVSLQEMAHYFPQTKDDFLRIEGVGNKKLEKFSDVFLQIINQHTQATGQQSLPIPNIKRQKRDRPERDPTYELTKDLLMQKLSINEIARRRGFNDRTIFQHIDVLANSDKDVDLSYLKPPHESFEKIKTAFSQCGYERLKPVFEALNEKYSYDEIRLTRAILKKAQNRNQESFIFR